MKKYAAITMVLISISNFMCHGASSRFPVFTRYCAGKPVRDDDGTQKPMSDYLQRCQEGEAPACQVLRNIITLFRRQDLWKVGEVERSAYYDNGKDVEKVVTRLLPPETHPCHNLIIPGEGFYQGTYNNSLGFPFAREWVLDGSFRKKIEKQYDALEEELSTMQGSAKK